MGVTGQDTRSRDQQQPHLKQERRSILQLEATSNSLYAVKLERSLQRLDGEAGQGQTVLGIRSRIQEDMWRHPMLVEIAMMLVRHGDLKRLLRNSLTHTYVVRA